MAATEDAPPGIAATIILPTGCKPWKACSRDDSRPALRHGYLRQRDDGWWLLTTDAYIACALKVQEATDALQEGWVPRRVLRAMAVPMTAVHRPQQVGVAAWKVTTSDGYATIEIDPPAKFPDLAKLGIWEYEPGEPLTAFGLDPRLLARLTAALGMPARGVKLEFTGMSAKGSAESPIRVTGGIYFPERIGLQMPVRLDVAK